MRLVLSLSEVALLILLILKQFYIHFSSEIGYLVNNIQTIMKNQDEERCGNVG